MDNQIKDARITYIDTIDRFATAILFYEGVVCAEFVRIKGEKYDNLEKYYGLGQLTQCGYDYGWVKELV